MAIFMIGAEHMGLVFRPVWLGNERALMIVGTARVIPGETPGRWGIDASILRSAQDKIKPCWTLPDSFSTEQEAESRVDDLNSLRPDPEKPARFL